MCIQDCGFLASWWCMIRIKVQYFYFRECMKCEDMQTCSHLQSSEGLAGERLGSLTSWFVPVLFQETVVFHRYARINAG